MAVGTCRICGRKRAFYSTHDVCQSCWNLTGAEGTRKKYGLPDVNWRSKEFSRKVKRVNRLRMAGKSQYEIAAMWGISRDALARFIRRARDAGFEIAGVPGGQNKPHGSGRKAALEPTPHGGGHAGRAGCDCQPCKDKLAKFHADNPRRGRGGKNEHGGGLLGITGCDCEPCVARTSQYKRDWKVSYMERVRARKASVAQSG